MFAMSASVINALKLTGLSEEEIEKLIERPKDQTHGDFAFPCFTLAKTMKKSPVHIAQDLVKRIDKDGFEKVEAVGPYINFFLDSKKLANNILNKIMKEKKKYGSNSSGKGKTIVIDMSSPNIAKPFGIGHLRSTIIGNSISEIKKFESYKTVKINYLGDWGTQFGKMIVGYKKFGNEKDLRKDPIKYMLQLYVEGNKEEYEQEARDWFRKLEDGNKEATRLWKMFKEISLKNFNAIYKKLGVEFDVISGESLYNKKMDKLVIELEKKGLLERNDGALIVDLNKEGLGVALIKKTDGATLYITRDLAVAIDRCNNYKFSQMLYEVGQEQKLHFKQLFTILDKMGYTWAKNCVHVEHGLYLDQDGKKFSTRKGKTVLMEEILEETIELAKSEIKKRDNLEENELNERARKIAIASIFYGDLKNHRAYDMVFDLERFISFEGDTGPYLLYSLARANSMLEKVKISKNFKITSVDNYERKLINELSNFPEIVVSASKELSPSSIAHYAYNLAQKFNEFYHSCQVIGSKEEKFRLAIVKSFAQVLQNALHLLGIPTLKKM
ncbi:arginine--tRNA ligase [Candidatus Pacearchaeota archaeon]|nr:arginine--tRNA ligase [Candidatus Pacearchaeota archaeon]